METDLGKPDCPTSKSRNNKRNTGNCHLDITREYFREMSETALLTPKEEISLFIDFRNGSQEAKERLIKANLRLVISLATDYERRYKPTTLSLLDLIQEGSIGLMRAVVLFDYTKGCKFSTYAYNWIKESMSRAIKNKENIIRIPVHTYNEMRKLLSVVSSLSSQLRTEPKTGEIARAMGIKEKKVKKLLKAQGTTRVISLSDPFDPDNDMLLEEAIADEVGLSPEEIIDQSALDENLEKALLNLCARERKVLELRFGLRDNTPRTIRQVGQILQISVGRVNQIQASAVERLKLERLEKI